MKTFRILLCLVALPLSLTSCKVLSSILQLPGQLFSGAAGSLGFSDATTTQDPHIQWDKELQQRRQLQDEVAPDSMPLLEKKKAPTTVAEAFGPTRTRTAAATP